MASKREQLRAMSRKMNEKEKEQGSAIENTENVIDIITSDTLKDEAKEDAVPPRKEQKPTKPAKQGGSKRKSKATMFDVKRERKSIQRSLYIKPSTNQNLEMLLEDIRKQYPETAIKTVNDVINEILEMFFADEE